MFFPIKQHIVIILLLGLSWSCFGLGIGMLVGQGVNSPSYHSLESSHGEEQSQHECCGVKKFGEHSASTNVMDHHDISITITDWLTLSLLLVGFVSFLILGRLLHLTEHLFFSYKLYFKQWQNTYRYFALSLLKLFSRGILHSKAW